MASQNYETLSHIIRLKSVHFEIKSQLSQNVTKPKLRDKVNIR